MGDSGELQVTNSAPSFGPINLTGVSSKVYSIIGNAEDFHRSSEQILRMLRVHSRTRTYDRR